MNTLEIIALKGKNTTLLLNFLRQASFTIDSYKHTRVGLKKYMLTNNGIQRI